ncbi:MAG: PDZ domain-containing protein [Clostridia bacterium]|nr:PDZ domain-containing protein [Clostridia bacterium]
MINQTKRHDSEAQLWIIITSVALAIAIAVGAIFFFVGQGSFRRESLEKDEILKRIEEYEGEHSSVADALYDLGFAVNRQKIKNVELVIEQYYYKETPSVKELTVNTALLFIDNFYDIVPRDNKNATTTAMLKCLVASIGDPYAAYFNTSEYGEFLNDMTGYETKVGIGVMLTVNYEEVTMEITAVLPNSGAEAAGIKKGDLIVAIDGSRVSEVGIEAATALVAGEVGTTVEITVLRDGEELTYTVTRMIFDDVTVLSEMLEGNIAYVQVIQFKESTPKQFKSAVDELKASGAVGFIFDMRGNPGGVLEAVVDMIDYVVPDGHRIASYTLGRDSTTVYTSDDGHSLDLPMTVLCNGGTASAGELFTAALRDFGEWGLIDVYIVGEQTYGKGVMQSTIPINGSEGIKLTLAYYNPPCDVNYDGVGVMEADNPKHLFVTNDGKADTQLEVAIERITELLSARSA